MIPTGFNHSTVKCWRFIRGIFSSLTAPKNRRLVGVCVALFGRYGDTRLRRGPRCFATRLPRSKKHHWLKITFFLGGGGGQFLVYWLLLLTRFLEMALLDNTSVKNEILKYEQSSTATGSRLTMTSTSTLCREAYYVCIVNTCS